MRKEQKPCCIKKIIEENFIFLNEKQKNELFVKVNDIVLSESQSCSPIVFQNTIHKLLSNLKVPEVKMQEMIYNQIMLSDESTIVDIFFDKKENGIYIDEDKLSDVIVKYFNVSSIPMPAIKNSLRKYMKKVKINENTLDYYLKRAFTFAENLCIEKNTMGTVILNYPELIQQSDWQYKYLMFVKIEDRKREELILDRSAFVPSCQLLYSKIKMIEYVENNENIDLPKSYRRLIKLTNESFYNYYIKDRIPIEKDQMRYYCSFWDKNETILPEVLEDILSWEGNEVIKENINGASIG